MHRFRRAMRFTPLALALALAAGCQQLESPTSPAQAAPGEQPSDVGSTRPNFSGGTLVSGG
jgi:hypothetical protein